jgi:phage shock protein A
MGLFGRFFTVIKSYLNHFISGAEDPEKVLNQTVLDMQNQFVKAKQQVAAAMADEKRLLKQAEEQAELATEWERKAMLAVNAGDDNLAKEALSREAEHERQAMEFKQQWELQHGAVEKLRGQLRELNDKIEEARRTKDLLIARQKRAEAQKNIQGTMEALSENSNFDTFGRMAKKIDQIEAEADAGAELGGELSGDSLAQKFKALEAAKTSADSDLKLIELKAKMGLAAAPARAALPAGKDPA